MKAKKLKIALLFGGRSAEHEVSVLSARSIAASTPAERFDVIPICIAKNGLFLEPERSKRVLEGKGRAEMGKASFSFEAWSRADKINVVFPIVHGTFGEDGSLQGYLEILGLPYVGSGVTASAIGMDKEMMKQSFLAAGLPCPDYSAVREADWLDDRERVTRSLRNRRRLPWFVKPACAGSSVGVSKVRDETELDAAMTLAFRFDEKVLVERAIDAREIEVAVLGNVDPNASIPGEIVPGNEFYDYEDKYVTDGADLLVPALVSDEKSAEIRQLAVAAFRAVGASGYSRVDFFLEKGTEKTWVNEINTIPGFTKISMFPRLWEATDLKYPRLIERLIDLALERHGGRAARLRSTMAFFDETRHIV